MANRWLIAVHLIGLVSWLGCLLVVSRMLVHSARQNAESQVALNGFARKAYITGALPAGILAVATGLLMLHGVKAEMFDNPGAALAWYFKPKVDEAVQFWYVTFHVKMVAALLLIICDAYLGRQAGRMFKGLGPQTGAGLAILAGLVTYLCVLLLVWLPLGAMGIAHPRTIGMVAGLLAGAAAAYGTWRAGKAGPARGLAILHSLIAALIVLILFVILGRPLVNGVPI